MLTCYQKSMYIHFLWGFQPRNNFIQLRKLFSPIQQSQTMYKPFIGPTEHEVKRSNYFGWQRANTKGPNPTDPWTNWHHTINNFWPLEWINPKTRFWRKIKTFNYRFFCYTLNTVSASEAKLEAGKRKKEKGIFFQETR